MRLPNTGAHLRLLDEVLPELVVNVSTGWLRRDSLHGIARVAEGSA